MRSLENLRNQLRRKALPLCSVAGVLALSLLAGDGCRAEQQPWPLWEGYTKAFIDDHGRVIDHDGGPDGVTTSEGQAYGMFFALVANDKKEFDKILLWTTQNLAQGDLTQRLPAWRWGKAPDGSWHVLDPNPASDADLWMAYDLLEAGRLWGDRDDTKIGTAMIEHIEKQEIVHLPPSCADDALLLPAPNGFHPDDYTWIMNPSYIPLPLVQYFATTRPDGPWAAMVRELPRFYNHVATAGFVPDWSKCVAGQGWFASGVPSSPSSSQPQPAISVAAAKTTVTAPAVATPASNAVPATTTQPAAAATAPPPPPAYGSFDAIRVYLWLGIADPKTPGLRDALDNFPGMAAYLTKQAVPPLTVDNYGSVKNAQGPLSFSAALIPYLEAEGQSGQATVQANRLKSALNAGTGLYGDPPHYYDQNMALFANGWAEKRYRIEKDGHLKLKWK